MFKLLKNKKLIVLIITTLLGAVGFQVSKSTVSEFVDPFVQESALEEEKIEEFKQKISKPAPTNEVEATPTPTENTTTPKVTPTQDFNKASAISPQRRVHILMGDKTGGGHMFGAGKPCKSEFPSDWNEEKIIETIDLIAANDNANWEQQRNGYHVHEQMVEGVKVRVVKGRENKQVITAYPLNMGRNPCPSNDN